MGSPIRLGDEAALCGFVTLLPYRTMEKTAGTEFDVSLPVQVDFEAMSDPDLNESLEFLLADHNVVAKALDVWLQRRYDNWHGGTAGDLLADEEWTCIRVFDLINVVSRFGLAVWVQGSYRDCGPETLGALETVGLPLLERLVWKALIVLPWSVNPDLRSVEPHAPRELADHYRAYFSELDAAFSAVLSGQGPYERIVAYARENGLGIR